MSVSRLAGGRAAPETRNEMLARVASATILGALSLVAAWLGGWAAAVAVSAAVIVVHLEWIGLTADRLMPAAVFTAVVVVSLALLTAGYAAPAVGLCALAVIAAALVAREPWRPAGVAYAAILGLGLLLLRNAPVDGLGAVLLVFAVVWGTDSGAFFVGHALGGPKLWPSVSPKKTWSGAVGGLLLGIVIGLAVAVAAGVAMTPQLALVSALLSIAAQAGDLAESAVKRHFGAKDAGSIVPGHGGLMDRVDGLVFAATTAVIVGLVHGGPWRLATGLVQW